MASAHLAPEERHLLAHLRISRLVHDVIDVAEVEVVLDLPADQWRSPAFEAQQQLSDLSPIAVDLLDLVDMDVEPIRGILFVHVCALACIAQTPSIIRRRLATEVRQHARLDGLQVAHVQVAVWICYDHRPRRIADRLEDAIVHGLNQPALAGLDGADQILHVEVLVDALQVIVRRAATCPAAGVRSVELTQSLYRAVIAYVDKRRLELGCRATCTLLAQCQYLAHFLRQALVQQCRVNRLLAQVRQVQLRFLVDPMAHGHRLIGRDTAYLEALELHFGLASLHDLDGIDSQVLVDTDAAVRHDLIEPILPLFVRR